MSRKKFMKKNHTRILFSKIGDLELFFINSGIEMIIKIDIWGPKNHGPPVELGYLDFKRVWKLNIKYKCWAIEIERQPFLHQNTKAIFLLIRICVFDFIFSFSAIILEKGQLLYLTITNDVKMFFALFTRHEMCVCLVMYSFLLF